MEGGRDKREVLRVESIGNYLGMESGLGRLYWKRSRWLLYQQRKLAWGEQSVGRKEVTGFSFGHMDLEILGDIHLVIPTMQQELDQRH